MRTKSITPSKLTIAKSLCTCLRVGKSPTAMRMTNACVALILGRFISSSLPTATAVEQPCAQVGQQVHSIAEREQNLFTFRNAVLVLTPRNRKNTPARLSSTRCTRGKSTVSFSFRNSVAAAMPRGGVDYCAVQSCRLRCRCRQVSGIRPIILESCRL